MTKDKKLSDEQQTQKDTAYSPSSDRETEAKQDGHETHADPDAARKATVLPGTGGPDDVGDIEVDEEELNMPHDMPQDRP
ncbi:MAG: hypothetical protein ACXIUP_01950 [Microcella sp.]